VVFIGYSRQFFEEVKTDQARVMPMKRNTVILLATVGLFVAAVLVVPAIAEALEPEPLPEPFCGAEGIEGCPVTGSESAPAGCDPSGGGCCGSG